jgi:hypothetical protein
VNDNISDSVDVLLNNATKTLSILSLSLNTRINEMTFGSKLSVPERAAIAALSGELPL